MPKLTDDLIRSTEPPAKGKKILFDSHKDAPKGFGIRITAGGRRVFILRYLTKDGKDHLLPIGNYGTLTLAAARKKGIEYRRDIESGINLMRERRDYWAAITVSEAVDRFLKSKQHLVSQNAVAGAFKNYLTPALGEKKLAGIRRVEVIEVLEDLAAKHPRQAGLLLDYTKQLFSWAEDRELIETSPVASLKALKIGPGLAGTKRARVLSEAEIRGFWSVTEPPEGMHVVTLLALKLILVTGQRPGEVAGMRWDEIQGRVWTVPARRRGKTEDAHTVPLTETAERVLSEARAVGRDAAEHVFEVHKGVSISTSAMGKAVKRCANALGMEEPRWKPHDLRRTMRTELAGLGISENVAEATIGHVRRGIVGVYDRYGYDTEKQAALEAWERRLMRIAEVEAGDSDHVVSIVTRPE